ncbi:hypothetical protein Swit_2197 [Rhizorhabdus wittichii RW1]|uniref:Uncharacterized protein n=1 Tax=Rhizorhabdus wittichii (strain DSM 6014 / CCUG 31198 / JCM 15750 / NBRC 105917 / EY 4224 / RW1) TaxID=392499 RepID=A0A9J9LEZ4_RHIWR|nr:hypothetical protein Swit_2197 [Rhizorhabdus wittichii RW1]
MCGFYMPDMGTVDFVNPLATIIGSAIGAGLTVWLTLLGARRTTRQERDAEVLEVAMTIANLEAAFEPLDTIEPDRKNWGAIVANGMRAGFVINTETPLIEEALTFGRRLNLPQRAALRHLLTACRDFSATRDGQQPVGPNEEAHFLLKLTVAASNAMQACRAFRTAN